MSEAKWFAMNTAQRTQHLKKFHSLALVEVSTPNLSEDGSSSQISPSSILDCGGKNSTTTSLSLDTTTLAGVSKLPLTMLQGIWNKATELLKTDGAVVPAPGIDSAMCVLSYNGKRPHLVTEKKGGNFTCDQDCPNWKGLGICSHIIAVAEVRGKLNEFITCFERAKKIPNLTKFAEATMPKGRGKKGCQKPRNRKANVEVETRASNPTYAETLTHSQVSTQVSPTPMPQMAPEPASPMPQQGTPVPPMPQMTPVPAPPMPQQGTPVPPMPQMMPVPAPPMAAYTSFSHDVPPVMCHSYPQFSAGGPSMDAHSTPFTLCKISGNISVCSGCRNKYPKQPVSPYDLCIRHQEWRSFMSPTTSSPQSRYGNVYYHFSVDCMRFLVWNFTPSTLCIPEEMLTQLTVVHKQHLQTYFQIHIA